MKFGAKVGRLWKVYDKREAAKTEARPVRCMPVIVCRLWNKIWQQLQIYWKLHIIGWFLGKTSHPTSRVVFIFNISLKLVPAKQCVHRWKPSEARSLCYGNGGAVDTWIYCQTSLTEHIRIASSSLSMDFKKSYYLGNEYTASIKGV